MSEPTDQAAIPMALNPGSPDHQRTAGQDKIGVLDPVKPTAAVAIDRETVAALTQLPVKTRLAESIRAYWIKRYKQDWKEPACAMIAEAAVFDLREPPKAALEAAGITDAQWVALIAAIAEGK